MPGTPWHQDVPHYPLRGSVATAWISLDKVNESNGAVPMRPRLASVGHPLEPVWFADRRRFPMEGLRPCRKSTWPRTIWFPTAAGDVIVHDGLVVHGSPRRSGASSRRRRALAVSYVGADVRHTPTPFPYQHPLAPDQNPARRRLPGFAAAERKVPLSMAESGEPRDVHN